MHTQPSQTTRRLIVQLSILTIALLAAPIGCQAEVRFAADDGRDMPNPERGIYLQFTSQAEANPLTADNMQSLHEKNLTLLLRMYYLKTFRDRPLSDKQLDLIRDDFAVMRDAGVKCVLRFAYSEGIGEPDAPIDVVLGHMDQLAPIIRQNADIILAAQAGFVGAWGEWHASTNDLAEPSNAKKIVHRWLDMLPETRCVQVRTPRQKWMILDDNTPLTKAEAFTGSPKARIGHHNDCFVSSETDVGTYENIEAEKRYLSQDTRYVPMGGETCALTKFAQPDNARTEFENLHFTYLNLGWHPDVIKLWQTEGFFKEVKRRLGYRLSLVSTDVPESVRCDQALKVSFTLENTGFAAPVNPRDVELILVNENNGDGYTMNVPVDPRTWLPGDPIHVEADLALPGDITPGSYQLFLALPDPEPALNKRPAYAIQLANPGLWKPATGRNDLGMTLLVE